jgi:hypothetical protein
MENGGLGLRVGQKGAPVHAAHEVDGEPSRAVHVQ